ncbi:MAG: hypothetical protein WCY19_02855 [Candidatus Gastranaerophilaceae bacterium]
MKQTKIIDFGTAKSLKEVFYTFFGMNKDWKLGRNVLGFFMVHCPEYPTYFIPTFTQAKATGDAGHLKKGEGPRGLITGGLEGVAVGALVSGEFLKPREMVPYIILGAGLQFFSSKFFPWIAEKMGRHIYKKRLHAQQKNMVRKAVPLEKPEQKQEQKVAPKFAGMYSYSPFLKGNLKI